MVPHPLILGGEYIHTKTVHEVFNPYTGLSCGSVCMADFFEAKEAVRIAQTGAHRMASLAAHERSAILHRLAGLIQEESEKLVEIIIREGGKARKYAAAEVARAATTISISAEEARRISGSMVPMDGYPAGRGRLAFSIRVPVGIVVAITPFNLPLNQICHKAGPAIAAGNSCIIKPSSATPLTALKFGELLLKAGLPKEALSVIPCKPEVAESIVSHPDVGALSFTGSSKVGWHLRHATNAGKITLELGGNAAVIVDEDTDLNIASSRIVEGAFSHAGQVCISVQRVFAHHVVYDDLINRILSRCKTLKIGDPNDQSTDIGPMINPVKTAEAYKRIQDAVSQGASVLCGGACNEGILTPTVLTNTSPLMSVNCEEVFAPILTITPYRTFHEAVLMVNDSPFGLQAGVFTKDVNHALYAANHLQCGAVVIGDIPTFRVDSMPYGGVKGSGIGREGPYYAIREMTEERLIILNEQQFA
ncbi:MAG: aldehyde dehydrogenase family protein [Methanomicrobiales archaeon]|nr:aldehyde dehydrogenase family protein [Methanomicrobiales archaeon]